MFWELEQNPWVVRNLLDNFLKRYSYVDKVKRETRNAKLETTTAPGGLSFCHDQGSHNQFSPFGTSAYELKDLTGCFSYMTQEQLCNWILIAASYVAKTSDWEWAEKNSETLTACLSSLEARAPDGILLVDSDRCGAMGHEITTYDSLDESLGQAASSLYLTVKAICAYWGLAAIFAVLSETVLTKRAEARVTQSISSLTSGITELMGHVFPANFDTGSRGHESRILAAVECLVFPLYSERLRTCSLQQASDVLKLQFEVRRSGMLPILRHEDRLLVALVHNTRTILSDLQGCNKFADGGIKLSSTSNNSWLSKIAIVQHVARTLFNLDENGNTRNSKPETRNSRAAGWEKSDAAHVQWLTTGPGAYWCASDQIVNGIAQGSRYYPRLITTALWLNES